jgi:putative glutathione S-transferase
MGMVVDGRWVEDADASIRNGAFVRASSTFDHDVPEAAIAEIARGSGRYVLVASLSCPWSHRVLLVRALKQLEDGLPVQIACGPRIEGYGLSTAGSLTGAVDQDLRHVHQLYTMSDPSYRGRATVPILWDAQDNRIVSNDSAKIMRALDTVDPTEGFTLVPGPHAADIDALNAMIHAGLAAPYSRPSACLKNAFQRAAISLGHSWRKPTCGCLRHWFGLMPFTPHISAAPAAGSRITRISGTMLEICFGGVMSQGPLIST